jgi:methylenetetrahydrofolate reductase (NADPH)
LATPALSLDIDHRQEIVDFMRGFSLETTPRQAAKMQSFRDVLRPGTDVYVTSLHGASLYDTVTTAARLRREGFNPVPHLAARSIPNRSCFETALQQLRDHADVVQVLLIGGGVGEPVGEYTDTMQLLSTGLLDKYGIHTIGVAGHPEGSPDIPDEAIKEALKWKNEFAKRTGAKIYVVTQFCFESEPILRWDRAIQAEGNKLPVRIGIPGVATIKTLLGHAKACGIGPSMRFISRQAMNVGKLLTVSTPDRLVSELAAYKARDPRCGIIGVHLFPLGGVKKSADWGYAAADGNFTLDARHPGFAVPVTS